MITLSQAFRLCDIRAESVFLRAATDDKYLEHYFWAPNLRELADMKKIKVVKIYPAFEHYGPGFKGMCFVVRGISSDKLRKLSLRSSMKSLKI